MKKRITPSALSAVLFLLLVMPVACLAFGGKVSYPNGSPAAGAQVSLVIDNTIKNAGSPAGTTAIPSKENSIKKSVTKCDSSGRFSFPDQSFTDAMIQVKAPNGEDFATVTLPAKLFAKGEVAIILQRK